MIIIKYYYNTGCQYVTYCLILKTLFFIRHAWQVYVIKTFSNYFLIINIICFIIVVNLKEMILQK